MQRSRRLFDSGELLISPVSIVGWRVDLDGTMASGGTLYVAGIPGLQVFTKYTAVDALKFASALGPFGDRGNTQQPAVRSI